MSKLELARDPQTPVAVLSRLVGDEHWRVRQAVAQNPHTPPELLEWLVQTGSRHPRPTTPTPRPEP